ncbi:hypothetical protein ACF08M_27135 [Streptomyces sp. NPDC015032]|uniref:hypothetical protein n=1 Tax=Streptomyces sp. NPDC015032 TaxID=3364937 RepID=UPI0036F5403E
MPMSVLQVPVTLSIPANPPDPGDGWWPRSIHHQALLSLLQGLTAAEYAQQVNKGIGTINEHRRACRLWASVATNRTLAHVSIAKHVVIVEPIPGDAVEELPDEVVKVWRHLADDVADRDLVDHIAARTGLSRDEVDTSLSILRSQDESDCALIARGYACGVLTGHETTQCQFRAVGRQLTPKSRPSPVPAASPQRRTDPLHLLPDAMSHQPSPSAMLRGDVVTGRVVDVVRVSPNACRAALTALLRTGERSWGPVLGDVEAHTALFLVKPGVLPDRWRTSGGRLWRRGATLRDIPASSVRGGSRLYWALEGRGEYWRPDILADLLTPSMATPSR